MARIYDSITDLVGNTPLVRLPRLGRDLRADLLLKLEYFNPCASVKDRIALSMVRDAREAGRIGADTILLEPTSGNTGIGLAFICSAWGIPLTLTMPDSMSTERRKLLKALGAELVLTPRGQGHARGN